jgi:ABC-type Fe3+/spermidine/putrescine transport system ATPase subunit
VSNSRSLLEVTDLSAQWGNEPVLRDLRFSVGEAEFLVLLGPNGSGKTTLLRCLAVFLLLVIGGRRVEL